MKVVESFSFVFFAFFKFFKKFKFFDLFTFWKLHSIPKNSHLL